MELTPTIQKFIIHWGEMGTKWGINRTVAQVHALLYISEKPLNAETITNTLQVARSNVSSSLHELQSWELIKVVNILGDRRDYFESIKDVFELAKLVAEGRKKREIDPTVKVLSECVKELQSSEDEEYAKKKLTEVLSLITTTMGAYEKIKNLPLKQMLKLLEYMPNLKPDKK